MDEEMVFVEEQLVDRSVVSGDADESDLYDGFGDMIWTDELKRDIDGEEVVD